MKLLILVTLLLLITTLYSQSQSIMDTIKVDYSFWGNSYYLDNIKYSKGEISAILKLNPKF